MPFSSITVTTPNTLKLSAIVSTAWVKLCVCHATPCHDNSFRVALTRQFDTATTDGRTNSQVSVNTNRGEESDASSNLSSHSVSALDTLLKMETRGTGHSVISKSSQ